VDVVRGARIERTVEHVLRRPVLDDVSRFPVLREEERTLLETRAACCMLCVTITIVTSVRSSAIVSSIRRVDVGSSAEHGSSISRTSGPTASARAMHSRCC
jgi:hypothetical protein